MKYFFCLKSVGLVLGVMFFLVHLSSPVHAHHLICVWGACPGDCGAGASIIKKDHEKGEKLIIKGGGKYAYNLTDDMKAHKWWLVGNKDKGGEFFPKLILPALMHMARQMSMVGMEQMRIIGQFFDAKHLMEHHRTIQELQVEANKDYHPSESFCWWGTGVRSLAESEMRGRFNQAALGKINMARQLGNHNNAAAPLKSDTVSRWNKFKTTYCDPFDHNWRKGGSGLQSACQGGAQDKRRINIDVDYGRLVNTPRTLKIDFHNTTATHDEEDVLALSSNLYGARFLKRKIDDLTKEDKAAQPFYLKLRSTAAKRAVAQDSFNAIVGMKSESTEEGQSKPFLAAIVRDTGIKPEEIFQYLGEKPSYYAQLEVMSKKIAQNPSFFVNLMDKPANVKRKKAAMNAIELMLDRAIFESELRQEMILSVLLSASAHDEFKDVSRKLPNSRGD